MFIQTEPTPNPATLKFLPGQAIMVHGTADFASRAAAERSPLAIAPVRGRGRDSGVPGFRLRVGHQGRWRGMARA